MEWYQILSIVISALTLCGFGVLAKLVIEDAWRKKKEQSEEVKKHKKQERQELYREVIQEELKPFKEKQDQIEIGLAKTMAGIQAELRHDIRNACRRCLKQGWKTAEDIEEVAAMHVNYELLGSNGKTNELYDEFKKLPVRPTEEFTTKKTSPRKKKKAE